MPTPEQLAREQIDAQLRAAGLGRAGHAAMNLAAGRGIAVREFPLGRRHGTADYLLYVDRKAARRRRGEEGGRDAHRRRDPDREVRDGLPPGVPACAPPAAVPLPVAPASRPASPTASTPTPAAAASSRSTGPRRSSAWAQGLSGVDGRRPVVRDEGQHELRAVSDASLAPPASDAAAATTGLWPAQIDAIRNLERRCAENRPRALDPDGDRQRQDLHRRHRCSTG